MSRRIPFFAIAMLGLAAASAAAQEQPERQKAPISADGTEIFQYLLDREKLTPIKPNEVWNHGHQGDVIVIVLGDPHRTQNGQLPLQMAAEVVQQGGAALIASDDFVDFFPTFHHARDPQGNTNQIMHGLVQGNPRTDPASLFLGKPNLPFVVPRAKPFLALTAPEWQIFKGLNRIATNQTSCIYAPNLQDEFRSPLATFPADCQVRDNNLGRVFPVDPDRHFFAVGGRSNGGGRFLAYADPSVFINQMMVAAEGEQRPVDNFTLAKRTIEYLAERGDGTKRTHCLLYQNGQVVEKFDSLRSMMLPPLPLPNLWAMQDKITDFANKVVDRSETEDTVNKLVLGTEEATRDSRFKFLMRFVLALLAVRASWYLLKRYWLARRPADGLPAAPGGLPIPSKRDRPASLFDRRQRELLRRNNVYEPVCGLIREMFAAAGAPAGAVKQLPKIAISDAVAKPETLRDALTDLWKIAHGTPRVVTVQRWNSLEPIFERVRLAHADGKWRFA